MFRLGFVAAALLGCGILSIESASAQEIEVTASNRASFLIIKGSLGLACHRPVDSSETLYGEIDAVEAPDGISRDIFSVRGRPYVVKLQRKYDKDIKTLRDRLKTEKNREARASVIKSIKSKLKLRMSLLKQVRGALSGCPNFTPAAPPAQPIPTPPVEDENFDEELTVEDSPFPNLPRDVDGTVRLDPRDESLVFYISDTGSDQNNGLSPDGAVKTFARAWQLLSSASSFGVTRHQIRFRRGGVYDDELLFMSGWSYDVPFVIGDYGSTVLPRPILTRPVVMSGSLRNIALTGLDFYNPTRDPFAATFQANSPDRTAIRINGGVRRILVQRSNIRFYTNGIFITGSGPSGDQLARRVALFRNNFLDLYNMSEETIQPASQGRGLLNAFNTSDEVGMSRFTLGVYAKNVNGINITGGLFARIGTPLGLSPAQGNNGQTVPLVTPDTKAYSIFVDRTARSYVLIRDCQFIDGVAGIAVKGYTRDQYGQLDAQLPVVEVYSNVFVRMNHSVLTWAPAIRLYDNAIVNPIRRQLNPYVSGFQLVDSTVVDVARNVFINSLTDFSGKDIGIWVGGYANFGYHKLLHNKFHNMVGEIIYGRLTWYDSLVADGQTIPIDLRPKMIVIRDNTIMSTNTHQALVEVAQDDRGINEMVFRKNRLWNPNAQGYLWATEEHATVVDVDVIYTGPFWNRTCVRKDITRSHNIRMTESNWYPSVGAGFIVPGTAHYDMLATWGPNKVSLACSVPVSVGTQHYLNTLLTKSRWYEFINRGVAQGAPPNELPESDPDGLRVTPTNFADPNRTIESFLAANDIQVREGGTYRPATDLRDYVDYVANFWRHTPSEDLGFDPRTWGKNVQMYFAAGMNIIEP